jgi:hypothetical protein
MLGSGRARFNQGCTFVRNDRPKMIQCSRLSSIQRLRKRGEARTCGQLISLHQGSYSQLQAIQRQCVATAHDADAVRGSVWNNRRCPSLVKSARNEARIDLAAMHYDSLLIGAGRCQLARIAYGARHGGCRRRGKGIHRPLLTCSRMSADGHCINVRSIQCLRRMSSQKTGETRMCSIAAGAACAARWIAIDHLFLGIVLRYLEPYLKMRPQILAHGARQQRRAPCF